MQRGLRSLAKAGGVFAILALTASVAYCVGHPIGQNCSTSLVTESWATDRAYKIALSKKDCNSGESIFYSARIDAFSPPLRAAWFTVRELDDDEYPERAPALTWTGSRQIEINMPTRTLNGRLAEHAGDDLTIIRVFTASKPDAFPSY